MDHGLAATILHVIGAGILIGIVFLSLVIAAKPNLQAEDIKWLKYIRSYGIYAAFLLLISGIYLAIDHWDHVAKNPLFWSKMALFLIDGFIAERIIAQKMNRVLASNNIDEDARRGLPLWTKVSALVIFSIVTIALFLANS